jgi:pseudouridine synthase
MKLRLHQYLSKTGFCVSKKELIQAVENGEITLDGKVVRNPHYQFNPKRRVSYKGKSLSINEQKYIIFNKPEGYLSSRLTENDRGKKSVFELVEDDKSLVCAGRLDEDTSGLLIITNDGKLVKKITSPGSIEKTYEALLEHPFREVSALENGVVIDLEENGVITKYKTKPCRIRIINEKKVEITLTEGKKREVRRMFEAVGNKVIGLRRISIGNIDVEKLKLPKKSYLIVSKEFIYRLL